jgi:hypothetical protein
MYGSGAWIIGIETIIGMKIVSQHLTMVVLGSIASIAINLVYYVVVLGGTSPKIAVVQVVISIGPIAIVKLLVFE